MAFLSLPLVLSKKKLPMTRKCVSEVIFKLSINVPSNIKLFRIGKNDNNITHPLRIIFKSKVEAASISHHLVLGGVARRDHAQFPPNIKFVRDESHEKLDRRRLNGEKDLSICYINGVPQVITATSKKRHRRARYLQQPTSRISKPFINAHYDSFGFYQNSRSLRTKLRNVICNISSFIFILLNFNET